MTNFILWEGASLLDGSPIACIAIMKSQNAKTGNMIQTVIIRTDQSPIAASQAGTDGAVCGSCIHRHSLGGACYVNLGQMPLSVYRAYKRGSYEPVTARNISAFYGRSMRLGAYGDPAAVPFRVWSAIIRYGKIEYYTGYTHQASHKNFDQALASLCMISADTPKQALKHHSQGKRTFRVKTPGAPLLPNEIECLSDTEGLHCIDCKLCDGTGKNKVNIAINVHGSRQSRYAAKYETINTRALT